MKAVVASINFHPDHSGIAIYATDLPLYLAEKGNVVTMITGFSYYPHWKKRDADKCKLFRKESFQGINVFRGYLYVPKKVTTLSRILHELSFLVFAFLNFLRVGPHEKIIILSPPLLLGCVGLFFKFFWRAKLVFHIQDFPTEAALSLGLVKESFFVRLLRKVEDFIYARADLIVTISDGMYARLLGKPLEPSRLWLCYNWINIENSFNRRSQKNFIQQFPELDGKFIIAYAGNLGIKQSLDVLINLAEVLSFNPLVHFFIIGEGADKTRLVKLSNEKQLKNLTFHPFLNQEQYREMLQDVNVSFVAQKAQVGNVFFPSKLLGIMAQSVPLLISADEDSELSQVVVKAGCGLVAPWGDTKKLRDHVEYMVKNPLVLSQMGENGFSYVARYDRNVVLAPYLNKMASL
jgi:colanic acid biosynthesis glycosyl transferase WcaI